MDKVKKHFQGEANSFDVKIIKTLPFYLDMVEALVSAISFEKNKNIKVIDLGCGTGTISKKIKERFPNAAITCVDFADNMLKIAKDKLKIYGDIKYVLSDCNDFDFDGYDVVLSSLTLHHIRDKRKKLNLYKKIFKGLKGKGILYVADLALGSSDYLQKLNLEKWKEFLLQSFSKTEIAELKKRYETEDCPFKLIEEISWLKEAGFTKIDVIWKYYHFAVYGGQKR